jgi:hypothetical protein
MNAGRVSPSVALAAYAEAWISGAKVVVFGDASSPLAERLVERGARHVQVYDSDAARAAEATAASTLKQVSYASLELAGSSLRDGFFDVGIVEDLAVAGRNPKDLLTPLSRALSRRGLALIGSRNPGVAARLIPCAVEAAEPLGYYDLYETVSQVFEEVRMLGQTPFVGYAIADFSASDASDVRLDTALLPGGAEEPEWFLALASAMPVSPDAFSVIQLPMADLDLAGSGERAERGAEASARAERAEAKVNELAEELARLAAERTRDAERHATERARDAERFTAERARDAERLAAEKAREAAERTRDAAERTREGEKHAADRARDAEKREHERQLTQKLQRLEAELAKREEWARGLESRAATADQRADDAQAESEKLAAGQRKVKAELEHSLAEQRRAKIELEHAVAEQRKARAELEQFAAEQRKAKAELEHSLAEQRKLKVEAARLGSELEEERRARKNLEDKARRHAQELERRVLGEEQRAAELGTQNAGLLARVDQLSAALAVGERKLKQVAEAGDEETRAELHGLEAMLKDRSAEVARLTAALHETERFGRQLIVELAELRSTREASPADSTDVQALSRRNAELAADLEAARWTISSLEANLLEANVILDPTAAAAAGQRRDENLTAETQPLRGAD